MAGTTIRELITRLGFEVDDSKLDQFERRITNVKTGLLAMTGIVAGAVAGLTAIAKSAANAGDDLDTQASVLGFAVEQLQIWTRAAGYGDLAAGEFSASIEYLNRNIGDAVRGQGTAGKTFKQLGIALKGADGHIRSTSDVMNDLSERFSHIQDPAKRASVAMDLFGRGGVQMGRFLAESADDVKRATAIVQAFGFFTAETASAADATNDSLEDTATLIRGMKNEMGVGLLPILKGVADRFNAWALANREVIKSRIDKFAMAVVKAFDLMTKVGERVYRWMESFIRLLGGFDNTLKLIGVALLAAFGGAVVLAVQSLIALVTLLGTAFLTAWAEALIVPALIAAAIALIALAIEDVYVWIKGGDSVIGDWLGTWDDFTNSAGKKFAFMIEMIKELWSGLKLTFTGLFEFLSGSWEVVMALWNGDTKKFIEGTKKEFRGLFHIVVGILETLGSAVSIVMDGIYEALKGTFKVIGELIGMAIPPSVVKLLGFVGDKVSKSGAVFGGFATGQAGGFGSYAGAGAPSVPIRPAAIGGNGPGVIVQGGINVGPTSVTLPAGTPEDQAKEMTRIFHSNMEDAITHSLQMSARPGG